MKILITSLFVFAASLPLASVACEPEFDQMEALSVRDRQLEEQYVIRLASEVDQIFIGLVTEIETLKTGPFTQRARVRVTRTLKGKPLSVATALMSRREEPKPSGANDEPKELTSLPQCADPQDPVQHDPSVGKTYRYLFYLKDGILIRANGFPVGPRPLEPDEETWLIQRAAVDSTRQ